MTKVLAVIGGTVTEIDVAASSGASGIASLNFGSTANENEATVNVTGQATITESSVVEVWVKPAVTANHSIDEHIIEPIQVFVSEITVGVGFTIRGICNLGFTRGVFNIAWKWS